MEQEAMQQEMSAIFQQLPLNLQRSLLELARACQRAEECLEPSASIQ